MIATAAEVMKRHALALNVAPELKAKLIDVVGTGGDKSGSFNVSSTVSILLSACGAYVAKHGNRSITSYFGTDQSGWDATQLLRPPGTTNRKNGLPVRRLS